MQVKKLNRNVNFYLDENKGKKVKQKDWISKKNTKLIRKANGVEFTHNQLT